ncbi:MAG: thiol protease/hemagglutinin PrtT [Bacteroidota bacterium]
MKKIILLSGFFSLFSTLIFAKHVDENQAREVGQAFLKSKQLTIDVSNLQLIYKSNSNEATYFYVFNINHGFIIVSGDDHVSPVLAYSNNKTFDLQNIPQNVQKWLEEYKNQIRYVIENNVEADEETKAKWENLLNKTQSESIEKSAVAPLMQTTWDQSPYVNAMCPGGSVTGCVATAMAQIMKYWNYPATGSGFHSYNHATYGTLSANFAASTYNWSSMPNDVNSANSAVAKLMSDVGISVDMDYSPQSSGAYVISSASPVTNCSEYALETYFGYKTTLQGIKKSSYTQSDWVNLLKAELTAGRPILYAGFGSGGGHCFVADGFDNSDYFHMNWGWGGYYDGYFLITALNPTGTGTGGGTGGFNSGHQAVIGIEPPSAAPLTYDLELYDFLTPSATIIDYGAAFSVSTNVSNIGGANFSGDYSIAIFDDASNFIDYVEIKLAFNLAAGNHYTNNLVFSNAGLLSMLPGNYYIGLYYRPSGGNWTQVNPTGSYSNWVPITIANPNDIELNSAMTVFPGSTLMQGQPASVNLNIINDGTSDFIGDYSVSLYDLDGAFMQSIEIISETDGLPPTYTYNDPYLTFSTSSINVAPGTYLLAVQHYQDGEGWELTGSSYYQNPIKVTVVAPGLQADIFEVNNDVSQAYNLPLTFSGNSATQNTNGTNIHIESDNDYFKLVLAAGFDYSIDARLHDSYNSGNGNIYSVDALFSYSGDGVNWSDAFDDLLTNNIVMNNGGTLYFHVAPYFSGETGTYLLDMTLDRTITTSISENKELADLIKVFPNPAKEFVTIELSEFQGEVESIDLFNIQGIKVDTKILLEKEKILNLSLRNYAEGVYFIRFNSKEGILTKKIIVKK